MSKDIRIKIEKAVDLLELKNAIDEYADYLYKNGQDILADKLIKIAADIC